MPRLSAICCAVDHDPLLLVLAAGFTRSCQPTMGAIRECDERTSERDTRGGRFRPRLPTVRCCPQFHHPAALAGRGCHQPRMANIDQSEPEDETAWRNLRRYRAPGGFIFGFALIDVG